MARKDGDALQTRQLHEQVVPLVPLVCEEPAYHRAAHSDSHVGDAHTHTPAYCDVHAALHPQLVDRVVAHSKLASRVGKKRRLGSQLRSQRLHLTTKLLHDLVTRASFRLRLQ